MSRRFVLADPHFDHGSSWTKWKNPDGVTPIRPFTSTLQMNQAIIDNANKVVGKNDILYILGDLAMTREGTEWVRQLPGRKRLALGNHDNLGVQHYFDLGFERVGAMYEVKIDYIKAIMTHIPLHPAMVAERWDLNIHGHLHDKPVRREEITIANTIERVIDPLYFCASVEQIDYTPISLEDVVSRARPHFSHPT